MVILAYICILIGAFLFYFGWKAKGGFIKLLALKTGSTEQEERMWRYVGNRVMSLGFIGIVGGVAMILMDKDAPYVLIAYIVFIGLVFLMLRAMMKQWDTGPQKK